MCVDIYCNSLLCICLFCLCWYWFFFMFLHFLPVSDNMSSVDYCFLIFVIFLGKINLNSRSKFTRSRISFSQPEGRMLVQWRLRRTRMSSSSRFVAQSTCIHSVSLMLRRPRSWSSPFPQVCLFLLNISVGR